jgi:uncharacterized membrane protein
VIEMVAIVVAVGVTRSWRAARLGAAAGLVVLVVTVAALGAALQALSLETPRLVVGALLPAFGSQWYRKGILIVSRDGWATGIGDEGVDADVPEGFDWTGAFLSFKGVSLEGLEMAVIVVAFGVAADALGSAIVEAAVSVVVVISALGAAAYRYVAAIPRRALQLFVGAMLITFGTFWAVRASASDGRGATSRWCGSAPCTWPPRWCSCAPCPVGAAASGARAGRRRICGGDGLMVVWRWTKRSACSWSTTSSATTGPSPP